MNMREDLKAFIDNELPEVERTRILKEIENDPKLQAEVIELRQMSRMIKEEAWQPQPVGLERTLGALLSNQPARKRPWWASGLTLLGAGACVLIVAAICFPVFSQAKLAAKMDRNTATPAEFADEKAKSEMEAPTSFGLQVPQSHAGEQDNGVGSDGYGDFKSGKGAVLRGRAKDAAKFNPRTEAGWSARASQASSGNPMAASPAVAARFQIKTGNLSVEVADVPKAQQEAEKIAKMVGGRIETSNKSNDEGRLASAELTLRVPVGSFETAVNRIRKLGRVLTDSLNGEDVTAQVVDSEARLKVMRAEEDQYVELLKATKKIGEVLSVKEKLSQVRQDIESLDATRKALREQSAESTINLSLSEKPSPEKPKHDENWLDNVWGNAVSSLNSVGRGLGTVGVFLFVFSPIWLPVSIGGWWWSRRVRRF